MKHLFSIILSLVTGLSTAAQTTPCRFGNIAGSNDFIYPQACVDSMLRPGNYKAIIYGEFHTRNFTPALKYHLLRHLNESYGYRHVFLETSYSLAWLINRYLETGDTMLLEVPGTAAPAAWPYKTGGYRDLWKDLYEYNRSLPPAQRFIIHGTDFERSQEMSVLQLLIPAGHSVPPVLEPVFRDIRRYAADTAWVDFTPEGARRQAQIREAFRANRAEVEILYGQNMRVVDHIVGNTIKQRTNWRPRNKTIGAAIRKAVKEEKIDKLICFFGSAHTDYRSPSSVPNTVNGLEGYNGKTLNIFAEGYHLYNFMTKEIGFASGSKWRQEKLAALYEQWIGPGARAALLPARLTGIKDLQKHADFVLLADDPAQP